MMTIGHNISRRMLLLLCALVVTGCSKGQVEPKNAARGTVVGKATLLATIQEEEHPDTTDDALNSVPLFRLEYSARGGGVAYIAKSLDSLRVVHNGKAGRPYQAIDNLRLSADGSRVAYVAQVNGKSTMVVDGFEGPSFDDIGAPVFSPDNRHVVYKVTSASLFHVVINGKIGEEYRVYNGPPLFSFDSKKIAYAEGGDETRGPRLVICNTDFSHKVIVEGCGDQLTANDDGSTIAAVCRDKGRQKVVTIGFNRPQERVYGPEYDEVNFISFGKDGKSIAYVGKKDGASFINLNAQEERLPKGREVISAPVVRPDGKGAGVLLGAASAVQHGNSPGTLIFHQAFYGDKTTQNTYDMIEGLTYSNDGSLYAYAALEGTRWKVVVNGVEGPAFDRAVNPAFSPDGKRVVYRARQDGKRFIVVADGSGKIVRRHNSYEMIFPPVFTSDGSSVAYGAKDGKELWWKVEKL